MIWQRKCQFLKMRPEYCPTAPDKLMFPEHFYSCIVYVREKILTRSSNKFFVVPTRPPSTLSLPSSRLI